MKKYTLFLLIFLFALVSYLQFATTHSHAASASVSATPVPSAIQGVNPTDQQKFIQTIVSSVPQMHLVDKKGFVGTVTDNTQTQITIADLQGNTRFIDVDELTKFSSPSAKASFGVSDLTKGSIIGVLGLYNRESRRTLARFVDVLILPQVVSGAVSAIDTTNFSITVTTIAQKDIPVDIESTTKTFVYTKDGGMVKSGFSKIQQGERVMVVGFPDAQVKNKIIASRIIRLPDVSVNPKIVLFKPGAFNVTPSTGSGTKLVPIIRNK